MKNQSPLKILMLASFLLTGAQALAGDDQNTNSSGNAATQSSQLEQPRLEVCFDQPAQFQKQHREKGFLRPGSYESRVN